MMRATRHGRPPAGDRRRVPHDGPRATVLLTGEDTGGRFALVESVETRGARLPCHLHHWEDETLYVLDGELTVYIDGRAIRAIAGTAVVLPRGVEHTFAVQSEQARLLTILSPPGCEGFYREMDASDVEGDAEGSASGIERLVTTAARYGCEITGPPHSLDRPDIPNATILPE